MCTCGVCVTWCVGCTRETCGKCGGAHVRCISCAICVCVLWLQMWVPRAGAAKAAAHQPLWLHLGNSAGVWGHVGVRCARARCAEGPQVGWEPCVYRRTCASRTTTLGARGSTQETSADQMARVGQAGQDPPLVREMGPDHCPPVASTPPPLWASALCQSRRRKEVRPAGSGEGEGP